jgi:RNA polymerase sigma factor for flagellar operon FliA
MEKRPDPADYIPLVESIVARSYKSLNKPLVTFEDLISVGKLELFKAAERFDPSKGAWPSFIRLRITGAIKDELRRVDPLNRSERARVNKEGAEIKREFVASHLSTELPNWPDLITECPRDYNESKDILSMIDSIPMSPKHRLLLQMRYREELGYNEIGKELGVCQSRVCQMHTEAIDNLRYYMENDI